MKHVTLKTTGLFLVLLCAAGNAAAATAESDGEQFESQNRRRPVSQSLRLEQTAGQEWSQGSATFTTASTTTSSGGGQHSHVLESSEGPDGTSRRRVSEFVEEPLLTIEPRDRKTPSATLLKAMDAVRLAARAQFEAKLEEEFKKIDRVGLDEDPIALSDSDDESQMVSPDTQQRETPEERTARRAAAIAQAQQREIATVFSSFKRHKLEAYDKADQNRVKLFMQRAIPDAFGQSQVISVADEKEAKNREITARNEANRAAYEARLLEEARRAEAEEERRAADRARSERANFLETRLQELRVTQQELEVRLSTSETDDEVAHMNRGLTEVRAATAALEQELARLMIEQGRVDSDHRSESARYGSGLQGAAARADDDSLYQPHHRASEAHILSHAEQLLAAARNHRDVKDAVKVLGATYDLDVAELLSKLQGKTLAQSRDIVRAAFVGEDYTSEYNA